MKNDCHLHPRSGMMIKCDACYTEKIAQLQAEIGLNEVTIEVLARNVNLKIEEIKRLTELLVRVKLFIPYDSEEWKKIEAVERTGQ